MKSRNACFVGNSGQVIELVCFYKRGKKRLELFNVYFGVYTVLFKYIYLRSSI